MPTLLLVLLMVAGATSGQLVEIADTRLPDLEVQRGRQSEGGLEVQTTSSVDECDPIFEDCDKNGVDECDPIFEDCDSNDAGECDPIFEDCDDHRQLEGGLVVQTTSSPREDVDECDPIFEDCDSNDVGARIIGSGIRIKLGIWRV